jgi:hypothetical protein
MTSMRDLSNAVFRKSRHSEQASTCVEVATNVPGVVAVRDTADRSGPVLAFTPQQWRVFTAAVKGDQV